MKFMPSKKGITFGAALLVFFIIAFVGFLAYVTLSAPPVQKTYFENLRFTIEPYKKWHVGVPIAAEGNLRLSLTTEDSVRVYAKYSNMYLLDKVTRGHQEFTMRVDPSMDIIEVAIVNLYNATVEVSHATCTLTS
jgi:hypothetical protein